MLKLNENVDVEAIDDYINNIRIYNEKNEANKYKDELKQEVDLKKKVELAMKAIAFKKRREEENE